MTDDRDFKRLVRRRMAETGETYTAARANLRAPKDGTPPPPADGIDAFRSFYSRTDLDQLGRHLEARYDIRVTRTVELDLGVFRVDRDGAPSWVARVFPRARPIGVVRREVAILRDLEEAGFPAERAATDADDPVSVLTGQPVLVTEFVPGPNCRSDADPATAYALGQALGRLHTRSFDAGGPRAGGWHHLSVTGGGRDADVAALVTLLGEAERSAGRDDRAQLQSLRRELEQVDDGRGLPEGLVHPDPCGANAIASAAGPVLVDWAGTGRGPRLVSVANLLMGTHNLASVDAAVAGYRQSVELSADELDRLEAVLAGFPLILACWSHLFQGMPLADVAGQRSTAAQRSATIAARVHDAFASPAPAAGPADQRPSVAQGQATLF